MLVARGDPKAKTSRQQDMGQAMEGSETPDDNVVVLDSDSDERSDPGDPKAEFINDVKAVFPNICSSYLSELYDRGDGVTAESLVTNIFDDMDKGVEYPKAKVERPLKRKREETSNSQVNSRVERANDVVAIFPDICSDFVSKLLDSEVGATTERLVAHILDDMDRGVKYPKARDKIRRLERKMEVDEDEAVAKEYGQADRERSGNEYGQITRNMLSCEFPRTPMSFIDATLNQVRHLFPAYRVLEEAERTFHDKQPSYVRLKHPRKMRREYREEEIERKLRNRGISTDDMLLAMRELQFARRDRAKADEKRQAKRKAKLEEEENVRIAIAEGTMIECGCCFSHYPLNRMIHCENEEAHWFCRSCAKQTAVAEIGNSKYELKCLSMDGCEYGFSREQKSQFLDEKTSIALDRIEQETNLRMAAIENLATCPFCPFAAEYPPVEEDRLFRCQNPDCEQVTCRLCKQESHIPKSCEENAKDIGFSVRRQIEEAMSAALIRKCNTCGTPFIKQDGCNKMSCTTPGCPNLQCYVCSQPCTYEHFDKRDKNGVRVGCRLYESVEERHEKEVATAERAELRRVLAEHPEYSEEDLKIKVSEEVKKSEARRREQDIKRYH